MNFWILGNEAERMRVQVDSRHPLLFFNEVPGLGNSWLDGQQERRQELIFVAAPY